ncbi:MAG: radical SAM protein [Chloroflexota bacterium]
MSYWRNQHQETGVVHKDWGGRLPVALIYPSSYYIGMSSLGVHAIYKLLNSSDDFVCERFFWERENTASPLLSLESGRPLPDFPLIAVSLTYELDYLNIAPILRRAGIPIHAAERDERHPLIIAGGPCITANPMPVAPFFDAVAIGEAEPILPPLLSTMKESMAIRRDELLGKISGIPGLYLPQTPHPTRRQFTRNLDEFPVASTIITRDTELGDLYLIEIQRGCSWDCRFCLVSGAFHPMRSRSLETILSQVKEGLKQRRRIGLVGPDVSDYPHLEELITRMREMGAGISVSSLRVNPFPGAVLSQLASSGLKTITLAPEAGSERLLNFINKCVSRDDTREAVAQTASEGFRQVKLYFMIGLPTEEDEDISAMIDLVLSCKERADKENKGTRLNLNLAPFIPKAGTPFQRQPMAPIDILNKRLARLKEKLSPQGITLKTESPEWSEVQAVLARGGSELARALADIDVSSLASWRKATTKHEIDTEFYAHGEWGNDQKLPWSAIDLNTKYEGNDKFS